MVKADDAPKISRLVERFHFATVDKAKIEHELVAEKAARNGAAPEAPVSGQTAAGPEAPDVGDTEKLLDELLGEPEGRAEPEQPQPSQRSPVQTEPVKPGKEQPESRPFVQTAPPTTPLSEPISESRSKSARGISSKPS